MYEYVSLLTRLTIVNFLKYQDITNCNARLVCSLYFSNDKNSMWADDDDMRYCTLLYGKHMAISLLDKSRSFQRKKGFLVLSQDFFKDSRDHRDYY